MSDCDDRSRVAIVCSKFNSDITTPLLESCLLKLKACGCASASQNVFYVPGAVETPLAAQRIARSKQYSAIIVCAAVIRGQTNHYDYVCKMVADGCMRVMLDESIPVIFAVLTTENKQQAIERVDGSKKNLGKDAAVAALKMLNLQLCDV